MGTSASAASAASVTSTVSAVSSRATGARPFASFGDARLDAIATTVRTLGFRIVKLNTQATGEQFTPSDFQHHVLTSVWAAFTQYGGSMATIEQFAWGTEVERKGVTLPIEEALTKDALALLRKEILGRGSVYDDQRLRATTRRNRAMVDAYQWSSWRTAAAEARPAAKSSDSRAVLSLVTDYEQPLEQEQQFQDKALFTLMDTLRDALNEREFKWLVERFARGVSLYEQVEEYITADAAYTGPHGIEFWQQCNKDEVRKTGRTDDGFVRYCKAANMINVAIYRARAKARKLLGEQWGELARELAA